MNEPKAGDLVTAEMESLARIIADIDAWMNDGSDDAEQPIEFISDLRDRLEALQRMEP